MTALAAFVAGLGVLLIFDGLTGGRSERSTRTGERLDRMAAEAGLAHLRGRGLLVVCAGAGVATLLIVAGLTGSVVISAAVGAGTVWTPLGWVAARRRQRRRRFREAWPDVIAMLIAGVRGGVSLPEVCVSLADRGPESLRTGFRVLAAAYRASGRFESGLVRMRSELGDPIADRVIASLLLAREVGGTDLVRVLRTLGDFVREDIRVRREVEARWSWTVTAARVAAGAPWVVLVLMSTRTEAAAAYDSTAGLFVILGGSAATLLGYRLMLRAARLPDDRRLAP